MSLGCMALIAAVFTLSAMTATWSSFTFLVREGDMSFAIDAARSITDLGLNQCVTANQA